ncbi:Hypothetical predicted protein, partial [Pelobates cultripes]
MEPPRKRATSRAKVARHWRWAKTQIDSSESDISEDEESALDSESDHSDKLSDLELDYKFEEDNTTPHSINATDNSGTELSQPAISSNIQEG